MTKPKAFRFGVAGQGVAPRSEWIARVRRIEQLGYSTLLIPDHFETMFSPLVALQAAADATTTLRVGSFVFDNDFRHPVLLAKDVATTDVLTEGRFEFGIGAGWHQAEYAQTGIPFDPANERINRLEEALVIIKGFFADEPVSASGTYYTVTNLNGVPKSVQKPHPPIFIGGGGKRLLTLAAREADIIGVHIKASPGGRKDWQERTGATLARKVALIREAAAERFEALELNILTQYLAINNNQQAAAEHFIREKNWTGVSVEDVLESPYILLGSVEQIVSKIQFLRERYHISYITISDQQIEDFAPVVAQLAGK